MLFKLWLTEGRLGTKAEMDLVDTVGQMPSWGLSVCHMAYGSRLSYGHGGSLLAVIWPCLPLQTEYVAGLMDLTGEIGR